MKKFIVSYVLVFIGEIIISLLFNPDMFPFIFLGLLLSMFNAGLAVTVSN